VSHYFIKDERNRKQKGEGNHRYILAIKLDDYLSRIIQRKSGSSKNNQHRNCTAFVINSLGDD
jgi:hypothetical protein